MATTQAVRYSTTNVGKSEQAQAFPWEAAVPVSPFWDNIKYSIARNFLANFTPEELEQLPIDPASTASNKEKLELLLHILEDRLAAEEVASTPKTLHERDYKTWNALWLGIYSMQLDLDRLPEADQTLRMMADRRPDKSNLSPIHGLSDIMLRGGRYAEAEKQEKEVCAWMDSHPNLGRDSPQAINARRIIAEALWMQGVQRREEAEGTIEEIWEIIKGMGQGKFAVYQEEEMMLMEEFVKKLDAKKY